MHRARRLVGVALSVGLATACGGGIVAGTSAPDAGIAEGEALEASADSPDAACPTNPGSAVGGACTDEGQTCGGPCNSSPCTFCNLIVCSGGVWTGEEVFPDPRCVDGALPTEAGEAGSQNDPRCPATWGGARALCGGGLGGPCTPIGLSCSYPGAGDVTADGQAATAVLDCSGLHADGGSVGQWMCAQ